MALRLITNATNQRTVIAAIISEVALGHKAALLRLSDGLPPFERPRELPMSEQQSRQPLRDAL